MEPTMSNIFLSQDGVIQMYLNNLMFINFSEYNKNEISNLYKTLYKYNVLNKNQKDELKNNTVLPLDKIKEYFETNLSPKKYFILSNRNKNKIKNNKIFSCNFRKFNLYNKKRIILRV